MKPETLNNICDVMCGGGFEIEELFKCTKKAPSETNSIRCVVHLNFCFVACKKRKEKQHLCKLAKVPTNVRQNSTEAWRHICFSLRMLQDT